MAWMLYDKDHPRYRGLVIRKNAKDLNDWTARAKVMYKPTKAIFAGNEIRFPSGGMIVTGHLNDENAYEQYQGHEYQKMLIEELTQIPSEESYLKLLSSCRSTIPELIPQVFGTTNPGGKGHKWVKKRFGLSGNTNRVIRIVDKITGRARVFIPAKVDDNPHIVKNDPSYIKFLDGLPDGLRQAWREGSWAEMEIKGAYYGKMLAQAQAEDRITFVPYDAKKKVFTVWDLGIGDSMSIGFWQKDGEKLKMIDYYENNNQGLTHYIAFLQNKGYIYGKHFAPHDINERELTTGKTRISLAKELGINFIVVPSIPVDDGIELGRIMFAKLLIDKKNCEEFLDAIRQYRKEYDEKNMCFKDKPVHDWTSHPGDMYRYTAIVEDQITNDEEEVDDFQPEWQSDPHQGTEE